LKIILVGNGELASALLLGLLESGHEIAGVLRWERVNTNPILLSIKDYFNTDKFYSLIKSYKIPEIKARSINSEKFKKQALKLKPDIILVGSWGEVLKKNAIILPKLACINCHPSLLPKHRGSNPYASVIKAGESTTGVTFHLIDENIDSGAVLMQEKLDISEDDTGKTIRTKCSQLARKILPELLDELANGMLIPVQQDEKKATYYPRLGEDDAFLDWQNSAVQIHNKIRAVRHWITCYTKIRSQFLKIDSSSIELFENSAAAGTVLKKEKNSLLVATVDKNTAVWLKDIELYGFGAKIWGNIYFDRFIKIGDVLENIK